MVLIVASPNVEVGRPASCTIWAAWPSVSMSRLPGSRTTICAFPSFGKNGHSDLRISPVLSWRRKSFHASLPITRSSGGIAFTRASVSAEDSVRIALPSGVGSRSVAPRRIWAATPSTTFPDGGQHEGVGELRGR